MCVFVCNGVSLGWMWELCRCNFHRWVKKERQKERNKSFFCFLQGKQFSSKSVDLFGGVPGSLRPQPVLGAKNSLITLFDLFLRRRWLDGRITFGWTMCRRVRMSRTDDWLIQIKSGNETSTYVLRVTVTKRNINGRLNWRILLQLLRSWFCLFDGKC